jgi:glutathione S-transferase
MGDRMLCSDHRFESLSMSTIKIFGVPFSQPVRAVLWLLLLKRQAFELVMVNPGSSGENGSRHPDFLKMNPAGTIPCLLEPDTGFSLGESHAIMTYLADANGWADMYPTDHHARAKMNAYLHYHHRNIREASTGLIAPKIRKDLNIPEALQQASTRNLTAALKSLEGLYLDHQPFLFGDQATIADLSAYVEIGQLQPQFTNTYDFSELPNVTAWLARMSALPYHDALHVCLTQMGDISQEAPSMDVIRGANIAGLKALKAAQEALTA